MKRNRIIIAISFLLFSMGSFAQSPEERISIIPEPVSLQKGVGYFNLPGSVSIQSANTAEVLQTVSFLKKRIASATGLLVSNGSKDSKASIKLILNTSRDSVLGAEGYHLQVAGDGVTIKANQPAGLFYGAITLLQLFPKEIEGSKPAWQQNWRVPVLNITDYPRFSWRGLLFDVSRHYFGKADVKRFIDNMVKYKYNLLHLHLTDDEGWRLQINTLPRLTEVGAWRVNKTGYFGSFSQPLPTEEKNYGGFFTQADIKELIAYASERFVNIMPEIDAPGHSLAAIASYPELSCTPGADKYNVRAGEPIMDWSKGAPPLALVDNTLCPANEKVYDFLDKVITEVAALFPFPYIHMGGDEAPHNFWEKNPQIKALMDREGLKTMQEVQGYFTRRVEAIVQSKGKKFIGWDEILDGKPSPNAVVMSWRGMEGGIKASAMGHDVIMSPSNYAYIDLMQGDIAIEPRNYSSVRLNKSYQFNPTEGIADSALNRIKGGQANLWTEQIYNMRHAEYMMFPRAIAIAESVWSPVSKKDWNSFYPKLEVHFERLNAAGIKYAPSIYDPIIQPSFANNVYSVQLTTEIPDLAIHYSFDNSFPDQYYPKYTFPLEIPKDAVNLKMITYRDGKPIGRMITVPVADLKARVRKK